MKQEDRVIPGSSGKRLDEDVLIRPSRGRRDSDAAPDLILGMTAAMLERLSSESGARRIPVSGLGLSSAYEVRDGADRPRLTLAGPFLGAPQAVLGLEKMIALGARRIWVTGWCGSLQPDLCIGDLVDPVDAVSDEGTSRHYPLQGPAPTADSVMRQALGSALKRRGLERRTGRIWSTDAVYRETRDRVQALGREGVLAVDMEMSALLTVAAWRGVRLAALLVVSDELAGLSWRPGFSTRIVRDRERAAVETVLEAADSVGSMSGT